MNTGQEYCEHQLPRNSELKCLLCLERYDPMSRKELIAECERLRAENETLRRSAESQVVNDERLNRVLGQCTNALQRRLTLVVYQIICMHAHRAREAYLEQHGHAPDAAAHAAIIQASALKAARGLQDTVTRLKEAAADVP